MKHAIIVGHPARESFAQSVAVAYDKAAQALGHRVVVRDLYAVGFDPRLHADEMPRPEGFSPAEDVVRERAAIADADVFVFVYPLWFYAPPAVITGYVQRVFGMGFGYGSIHGGRNEPLLTGRRMVSFTSSGAPSEWLQSEGAMAAFETIFNRHLAEVCGLLALDHVHVGSVLSHTPKAQIEAHLHNVSATVERLFKAS